MLTSGRAVLAGDLNLDTHRKGEYKTYNKCNTMESFLSGTAALGYVYSPTVATWVSYGLFGEQRVNHRGCIDHVYTAGIKDKSLAVTVLNNWTTDHRPVLAIINGARSASGSGVARLRRRNFKRITQPKLEAAL
jgi:endonuclease/exonuclease/phosphatase family metal-dependent hydrolase